jgi:GTP-binding protein YchF
MKLGLIGLPQSGKSTIFAALTGARGEDADLGSSRTDTKIATVTVFDERIQFLSEIYKPKKTIYAKIEYLLPTDLPVSQASKSERAIWNQVRPCDALLHVVRNFQLPGGPPPSSEKEFWQLEEEMILSDLIVAEKRLERIELDRKRGKKPEGGEDTLLRDCMGVLEPGRALRGNPELASQPALRGFTFLSAKPMLVICNNEDEEEALPEWERKPEGTEMMAVRGRLETDIAAMSPDEAKEFLEAYHIEESALDRVIRHSYRLLDRIAFFTVGPDEVRAWPIAAGTPAVQAAGAVHSDIEKGFIRAEVLSCEDFKAYGGFQEAKKAGQVRLEGKEYQVKDGDIINFRFNV